MSALYEFQLSGPNIVGMEPLDEYPELRLVPDTGADLVDAEPIVIPESIIMQEAAFESRTAAELSPGANGEQQIAVQESTGDWLRSNLPSIFGLGSDGNQVPGTVTEYTRVLDDPSDTLVSMLTDYLEAHHGDAISPVELQATRDFLNASFAIQADVRAGVDLSQGRHNERAFVVPVRLSRKNSYADELRTYIPALRYVPDEYVSTFVRDLCPFIMDNYKEGGRIVVSPSSTDIATDLGRAPAMHIYRDRVNLAIATAKAFGARRVGIGATLPGVMKYGEKITVEDIVSTTGHGGTAALISLMIDRAMDQMKPAERKGVFDRVVEKVSKVNFGAVGLSAVDRLMDKLKPAERDKIRIGVLGLGAIGLSAAKVIAELYPDVEMYANDILPMPMKKLREGDTEHRFSLLGSAQEVIEVSDIVISTVTSVFDFENKFNPDGTENENYINIESLRGKKFIDDSEPRSLLRAQVVKLGGVVLDVIGQAYFRDRFDLERQTDSGYGHTLADGWRDAFGCELEAALLDHIAKLMEADGHTEEAIDAIVREYAVQGPVTVEMVRRWKALFKNFGVGPAPEQSSGILYEQASQEQSRRRFMKLFRHSRREHLRLAA